MSGDHLIVPGRRAVRFALEHNPGRVREILASGRTFQELKDEPLPCSVREVEREELDRIVDSDVAHGGVVAYVLPPVPPANLEALAQQAHSSKGPIVILDGVTDARNLGAIMRTALWFGSPGLITIKRNTAPLTPAGVKASAGAACALPIFRVPNLARALDSLKDLGVWVYAADASESAQDLSRAPKNLPAALILGDEGQGVRPNVLKRADVSLLIKGESKPGFDSLNVGVSAGVLLSWFYQS
jgi:23S rRNA (guanosine2251-2'-O)-methyltransferase